MSGNHQSDAFMHLDSCMSARGNKLLEFVKALANHYVKKWEEIVSRTRQIGRRAGQQSKCDMAYTPQHVANYFLDRAESEGGSISPLKLLKLVYIAYGWCLALTPDKLFNEKIEAWQHGPVVPSIYHEFKHFRSSPIVGRSVTVDFSESDEGPHISVTTPRIPDNDVDVSTVLDTVWRSYKDYSAWKLREMTHEENTPWSRVYVPGVRGIQLQDEHIREHYTDKISQYIAASSRK